ncbi:AEC family transporter [Glaciecola sp. KUL10]|uniref:AEC family transporter n=1 Tax=Glaciecola sp. (strain KUL10) TaxID=2161813 RepID=UPI000D7860EA|nr:AEC family transporter [Glaciecola sp. KUL10]GBL06125.1 malonate transporter [Glaciecola sp. KUL10]
MKPELSHILSFSISVIGPVVLLIAFGYFLYKQKLMTDDFVERASRLIFHFALPALLFSSISKSDLSTLTDLKTISVGISGTLIFFVVSLLVVPFLIERRSDRGVVIQGSFRANMGIIGLAYCQNAYGDIGLAYASIYMGCLTIVYNVLSVGILNIFNDGKQSLAIVLKGIASNPIIIAIIVSLSVAYFKLPIPNAIDNSIGYFAQLTLPLALLCTGASLRFSSFSSDAKAAGISILAKCIFYPLLLVTVAIYFDIEGMALGVVFLMAVCPTAAASYVMVRKIGGNHILAAHIIAISTLLSVPFTVLGYALLSAKIGIN